MDTINVKTESYFKNNISPKTVEVNNENLLKSPDFIENCLKILEKFTLMLLDTNEKLLSKSKLNYCYFNFNAIRWQLENHSGLQRNLLIEISRSIITRLQSSMEFLHLPVDGEKITDDCIKCPAVIDDNLTKLVYKKKTKRKSEYSKKSDASVGLDKDNAVKLFNDLFGIVCSSNGESFVNDRMFSIQHIVDQIYLQTRAVLSENCFDDSDILSETIPLSIHDLPYDKTINLPKRDRQNHPCSKYRELWSGDCKVNDKSSQELSSQLDKLISESDANVEMSLLADRMFTTNNDLFPKNRCHKDSDMDEGFSENEFLLEIDLSDECIESLEPGPCEQFSYCGDCHYNSSNSKSNETIDSRCPSRNKAQIVSVDDGSDSDGGTELLNSVNETLDKFNAFMQNILTTDRGSKFIDGSTQSNVDGEFPHFDSRWRARYQSSAENNISTESSPVNQFQKKSLERTPCVSTLLEGFNVKEDKPESSIPTIVNLHSLSSVANLSKYKYESPVSKFLMPPMNIHNWYSYNVSPMATHSCGFNYQSKPEFNNSTADSFCTGKLSSSNWLPPISQGMISTNSFFLGSNHPPQPIHRIMLSSHMTVPSANINTIQHNAFHLPQIFHQIPSHTMIESDYFDLRQMTINQSKFTNPNNNNSSCDYLLTPSNLLSNSNCSNITVSSASRAPISIIKSSLNKSQRACCFYMRGGCKKEDCEYAHDLSKVTCKFWEKGDCFKAETCPFKHGYSKD